MTNRNSGNENESAKTRYKNSLERLETIFRDMSDTVQNVSQWRCPYKNVENLCTAKFGCRNQDRDVPVGALFKCLSDDKLDFRSAWGL